MISVILPVHNEEQNILKNIQKLKRAVPKPYEIIVVDDGSDDDLFLKLEGRKDVKFCRKHVNQGKGAAVKTGAKMASGDFVILIDGDLQIDPKDIETFFKVMELYDADVVIGNKRHLYSSVNYSTLRWVVSNSYNLLCRVLFGIQLRDTQTGLKLFKKSVLFSILDKVLVKRYAFDIEVIVALKDNSFRIVDAPVSVHKTVGSGSVSLCNILNTFKDTLAVWYRRKIGWYKMKGER